MLAASRSMSTAMPKNALSKRCQQFACSNKKAIFSNKRSQHRFYSDFKEEPKKSSFSLTKLVFKLSALTAAVYGTAATAALIYEPLQDPYLDYFPYGEKVMDSIDYTWKHRQEIVHFDYKKYFETKYSETVSTINGTAEKLGLDEYIEIPNKGIEATPASEKTKEILKQEDKKENFLVLSNSDVPKPAEKKITLPLISVNSADINVNNIVSSLNSLINEFNSAKVNDNSSTLIDSIKSSLDDLSNVFNSKDIQVIVDERLVSIKHKFEQEKTSLIQQLALTAENTKKELEAKHKTIIDNEVSELKKSFELEYQNKLKKAEIDLLEKFNDTVSEKIECERNNKLKDLQLLATRVEAIEKFELELSKVATSYTTFKEIRKTISKIRSLLVSNISSDVRGENLVAEIDTLKTLTEPLNNDLINATLNAFPSNKELLLNGGVLTQAQILSRWELLADELRPISLLPENPGVLGYAASSLFSKLLWSKSGVPIKTDDELLGNDVEAVIARVNNYLQKNQLDDAVEEVSNLKGCARELATDWLDDARRKLEIQFLVDVLSTEVNVSA